MTVKSTITVSPGGINKPPCIAFWRNLLRLLTGPRNTQHNDIQHDDTRLTILST
jgi:hypothetical protein